MESGGARVRGRAYSRARENHHGIESYDLVQSHHTRGAREVNSVARNGFAHSVVFPHKITSSRGLRLYFVRVLKVMDLNGVHTKEKDKSEAIASRSLS